MDTVQPDSRCSSGSSSIDSIIGHLAQSLIIFSGHGRKEAEVYDVLNPWKFDTRHIFFLGRNSKPGRSGTI
jgi:hypothetical protein